MNFKTFSLGTTFLFAFVASIAGCSDNSNGPAESAQHSEFTFSSSETAPISLPTSSESTLVSSSEFAPSSSSRSPQPISSATISSAAQSSSAIYSSSEFSSSSQAQASIESSNTSESISVPYGCIASQEDDPPYENFENAECVIKQLTNRRVETLVKQGLTPENALNKAKLELYSTFSIDTLLQTQTLHASSIGTTLSLLIPLDDDINHFRTDFIEAFSKGESFDYEYRCRAYENVSTANLQKLYVSPTTRNYATKYFIYNEANLILRNLWRYCGQLPLCNSQNANLYKTYNCLSNARTCQDKGKVFICSVTWTTSFWTFPTTMQTETYDKECVINNTRLPSDSVRGEFYVCYEGKWYYSRTNQLGIMPKDYFFNENIKYDTMVDPRDGKKYRTVIYENQVWMAENINYYDENDSLIKNFSMCSKRFNCDYGRFYAADASTKACPEGWHLPKVEEVTKWLEMPYAESSTFMPKLFSHLTGSRMASNEFGLSILPISSIYIHDSSENRNPEGDFWLDSLKSIKITDAEALFGPQYNPGENILYIPVRCIKD